MSEYKIRCETCKHYEANHQFLNPLAVARHWCKKCEQEIYCCNHPYGYHDAYIPKSCYLNNYYEESEQYKAEIQRKEYQGKLEFCQIED